MQYVPAQDHSAAIIAWLTAIHDALPRRSKPAVKRACRVHVHRLSGYEPRPFDDVPRLLTPARADAWLREHVASEPTSLLQGVVL